MGTSSSIKAGASSFFLASCVLNSPPLGRKVVMSRHLVTTGFLLNQTVYEKHTKIV